MLLGAVALLSGCGGDEAVGLEQTGVGQGETGEDVLLFSVSGDTGKSMEGREFEEEKGEDKYQAVLPTDGSSYASSIAVGTWRRHRFWTGDQTVYWVEVHANPNARDDPDIFIGRNKWLDPCHYWQFSFNYDPEPDAFVFRAAKSAYMYLIVRGYDDDGDGRVDYWVRVSKARLGVNYK